MIKYKKPSFPRSFLWIFYDFSGLASFFPNFQKKSYIQKYSIKTKIRNKWRKTLNRKSYLVGGCTTNANKNCYLLYLQKIWLLRGLPFLWIRMQGYSLSSPIFRDNEALGMKKDARRYNGGHFIAPLERGIWELWLVKWT